MKLKHPEFELKPKFPLNKSQERLVKDMTKLIIEMGNRQYFLPFQRGLRARGRLQNITSI